ncbi:MAG TPA: dihydrolipoamide acetyltransferase family protein [Polyangiaceae bacterium]|nr:dihydrolipoamide acetyltransferase family protein [Polyangiaceae bacterium]
MAKILEMPKLSPTMEEGVLSAWHKKEGDEVAVDDLLAEVETDKATMEFRAFDRGTLLKLLVPAGANVKLGQPVAIVGAAGEDIRALVDRVVSPVLHPAAGANPAQETQPPGAGPPPAAPSTPPPALRPDTAPPPAQREPRVVHVLDRTSHAGEGTPGAEGGEAPEGARVVASPYVRKVARERGIDLHGAKGTGPGGRVVPGDLDAIGVRGSAALMPPPTAAVPTLARTPGTEPPEARPLSPMRKTIARRLTEAKATVPHFYLSIDVDAARLVKLREEINAELAANLAANLERSGGGGQAAKVSVNDLLIKACAVALTRVPECNASFTPEAILVHKRVDISVAVAIPDGLVTPVVRRADQKGVVVVATEVRELAARARARKLRPDEMTDGTFSISNLGMFGVDQFSAVINPPEGAILAVGQVRDVPVVADGAVVPGRRIALTLSCDHRVVDGATGAAFLAELRQLIEHPLRVLMG